MGLNVGTEYNLYRTRKTGLGDCRRRLRMSNLNLGHEKTGIGSVFSIATLAAFYNHSSGALKRFTNGQWPGRAVQFNCTIPAPSRTILRMYDSIRYRVIILSNRVREATPVLPEYQRACGHLPIAFDCAILSPLVKNPG